MHRSLLQLAGCVGSPRPALPSSEAALGSVGLSLPLIAPQGLAAAQPFLPLLGGDKVEIVSKMLIRNKYTQCSFLDHPGRHCGDVSPEAEQDTTAAKVRRDLPGHWGYVP